MSAALNGLGHQLFGWLGPLSIELAALALLVLAVGRVTRSPALRHLLWLAVLVKPLVAVVVSSPYTILAPLAPLAEPGWDAIAHGRVEHLAALAPVGATTASTSAPLTAVGWAALLWLVGATLLTVRILVGFGILRRMRRQALVQRDGPLFAALRQARAALHYHPRGEVATSPSIHSPMVLGILRPLIVVPTQVVERLSPGELSLVLMHELAHMRRCDNLALLLQRLVSAALFFHPAVWLGGRMLRREAERACDDLVVCSTRRPEAYARGLTLVAEGAAHSNPPARRIPMMSTLTSTESDLSQRIRRTLDGRARRMGMRARVLAVGLLGPLAAVTMPSYGAADNGVGGESAMANIAADPGAAAGASRAWRKALESYGIDPDEDMTLGELTERIHKGLRTERIHKGIRTPQEIDTEGVRRRIVAVTDSGEVTMSVAEWSGRKEVMEHRVLALARSHVMRKAVEMDPEEWSDEVKALLLALRTDSTIEEIAEFVRGVRSGTVDRYSVRGMDRTEPGSLFLMVGQEGNMKLNDKPVTLATLGEELKKQRSLKDSTSMIIIQGDKRVTHAHIVEIMDIARQAGLVKQVIAIEPQPGR